MTYIIIAVLFIFWKLQSFNPGLCGIILNYNTVLCNILGYLCSRHQLLHLHSTQELMHLYVLSKLYQHLFPLPLVLLRLDSVKYQKKEPINKLVALQDLQDMNRDEENFAKQEQLRAVHRMLVMKTRRVGRNEVAAANLYTEEEIPRILEEVAVPEVQVPLRLQAVKDLPELLKIFHLKVKA